MCTTFSARNGHIIVNTDTQPYPPKVENKPGYTNIEEATTWIIS